MATDRSVRTIGYWAVGVIAVVILIGLWSFGPLAAILGAGAIGGFGYLLCKDL